MTTVDDELLSRRSLDGTVVSKWLSTVSATVAALIVGTLIVWGANSIVDLKVKVLAVSTASEAEDKAINNRVKVIETSGIDQRFRRPEAMAAHEAILRELAFAIDGINRRFKGNESRIAQALRYQDNGHRGVDSNELNREVRRIESLMTALKVMIVAKDDRIGAAITVGNSNTNHIKHIQRQMKDLDNKLNRYTRPPKAARDPGSVLSSGLAR